MKRFFAVLAVLSTQISFCADLMHVPFDQTVPTASDVTNIVRSLTPEAGVDTNAVKDIVNGMTIKTNDVVNIVEGMDLVDEEVVAEIAGIAVTNAFGDSVQTAVDDYISNRGVSSVVTNLFERYRPSFVANVGGEAYGLMNAETTNIVVTTTEVVFYLNIARDRRSEDSDPGWMESQMEIRFKKDSLVNMLYYMAQDPTRTERSSIGTADVILKRQKFDQTVFDRHIGVQFNRKGYYSSSSRYYLKATQLNGTYSSSTIQTECDNSVANILTCMDSIGFPEDQTQFSISFVFPMSTANELYNYIRDAEYGEVIRPSAAVFYAVLSTYSPSDVAWYYFHNQANRQSIYDFSTTNMYFLTKGDASTNTVPYGPMSPVITEWHLNNVSNDWNNIVQSTIDNEKSFFVYNLRLAETLVSSASNVVDRAEALGQSIDSVSNSLVGISSEAYSAMSDSVSAAYLVFSNRLESSEEFLHTTMTNFEESAQTIQSSITDISNYVSEAVVSSFRESSAEYYFATNAEISSIRQYGVVTVRIPPEVAVEAYGGFENPGRVYSDPAGYPGTTVQIAVDSKYSDDVYALLEEASDPSNQTSAATEHFNKKVPCICTTYFDSTQLVSRTTATYLVLKSSAYFNSGFSSTVQDDGVDKTGVDSIEPRSLRIDKRGLCFSYICVGAPVINFYNGSATDLYTVSRNSSVTYSTSFKVIYMMFPVSDFNLHTDITNSISPGSTARFLLNSFDQYSEYSYDTRPSVLLMYGFGADKYNPAAGLNACSLQNATVTLSGNDFITNGVSGGVVKYLVPTTLFSGYLSSNEVDRLIDEKLNSMH